MTGPLRQPCKQVFLSGEGREGLTIPAMKSTNFLISPPTSVHLMSSPTFALCRPPCTYRLVVDVLTGRDLVDVELQLLTVPGCDPELLLHEGLGLGGWGGGYVQ